MPKGVEHYNKITISEITNAVFHSLMPKGVEHLTEPARSCWPLHSCFIR